MNECITQRLVNGIWNTINFEDLKCGDKFRQIVGNSFVVDDDGKSEFIAFGDPYFGSQNEWEIEYE